MSGSSWYFVILVSLLSGIVTEGKNFYISRASGEDSWSCEKSKPCKTISRAVELASSRDHILLDGSNTDKDPYNCQSRSPKHSGVQINKSLSIIGYGSPMPYIQCKKGEGLQFNGSPNEQQMKVTLSRLLVSQSSIMVQDSSVHIDGCVFESGKGVVINIRTRLSLNILVTNSIFYKNSACISVVLNSTKKQSKSIQVVFKMRNSSFLHGNVGKDLGRCISFTESNHSGQSVSCNITLKHTTFFSNKLILPQGLIFLEINNGSQHIQFQNVTFFDNGISSSRTELMNDSVLCIVNSTDVNISISSSKFSSEYAKVLNGSAEDISLHVYNSTFHGHRGRANGGVISLQGTNLCKLNVSKSSFVNTSAVVGGAISIECPTIDVVSFNQNNFTNNTAFIGGGAIYIKAVKASVELRYSIFTNCITRHVGGSGVFINSRLESTKRMPGNELLLTVESCEFTGCITSIHGDGGSLSIFRSGKTKMEININKCSYISNFNGALWLTMGQRPIMALGLTESTGCNDWNESSYVRIQNSLFLHNVGTNVTSTIKIGVSNKTTVIFQNVTMELNTLQGGSGGAASVESAGCLTIQRCRFLKNTAFYSGNTLFVRDVNSLRVRDSYFEGNKVVYVSRAGSALSANNAMSIVIFNTTFKNCSGVYGGAIIADSCDNITINKSQFVENIAQVDPDNEIRGRGGATSFFNSKVIFEETKFQRNTGFFGGAVELFNSNATFKNCYAVDNFAASEGGFLYAGVGANYVVIQDSILNRTITGLKKFKVLYKEASFIRGNSLEGLRIFNTKMEATSYDSNGPLLLVKTSTVVDFGKDNSTSLTCPIGSKMEFFNYNLGNDGYTWQFSCSACAGNSYSLQRGRAVGSCVVPGFQCLPCPFGANCSRNIIAKPNFWGFKGQMVPPVLKFALCPVGYCSPPNKTEFPKYNGCQGNRNGKLCGHCSDTYSETLYSAACRPSNKCNDHWFWPVALVYVSLMAVYLTFKPPIIPWIMRQIKWFKTNDTVDEELNNEGGYIKIIFFFYQAADLLLASKTSLAYVKGKLNNILVGVFNFRQSFSTNGVICPFPGLTVVTKQLFPASYVFGTSLMIGVFYYLHRGAQRCRRKEAPSFSPYMAGILQTLLLGYKTIASVSFNLLRCVPIGSEKRLLLDGNVVCYQWWQYILIALVFAFFVPFVFVLFWGCYKLHNGSLFVTKFLLACCFPLPFFVYWLFISLPCIKQNASQTDTATRQMVKRSVEATVFGCFKKPAEGSTLSLGWESIMIGRRLILILLKTFVNEPMPRLLIMSFLCVLFLLHHAMTQPFRNVTANNLETISLLSLVLLGMVNMFFASFVSLAVPLTDHFQFWWRFCEVVETVILCAVPAIFGIFVIVAALSLVIRFLVACFSWCCRKLKRSEEIRPLLSLTD